MNGIALGLLIPLLGTVLGAGFVFFMRHDMPTRLQKSLLGFASGVMVAASVWSLLMPSMEMSENMGKMSVVPAAVGFLLGMGFLLCLDYITPHLHLGDDHPEGPQSRLSRTAMLTLAVTLHNLPEGMAVGVVLAGALQAGTGITAASALALSLGIAIGVVEPLGGLLVILLAGIMTPILPYMLSFAAGAMIYVVIEELIPESAEGEHSNLGTIGFAIGFALMMVLDVVLD